jgi:hypothetical protein
MADIEYPFITVLNDHKINFSLLNPNKGTLKRMQSVINKRSLDIYVTCMDEEDYDEYQANLEKVNEANWPVHHIAYKDLPKKLYYAGFTTKKYIYDLDVIGYEMNPRNVVMTCGDDYDIVPGCDEFGSYDQIRIQRDWNYTYDERYYHKDTYSRYCPDVVESLLKSYPGYFSRPYALMYNVISSEPLSWMPKKSIVTGLTTIVGLSKHEGHLNGPYDSNTYIADVRKAVVIGGELYQIKEHKGSTIAIKGDLIEADPYMIISPYEKFARELQVYADNRYKRRIPVDGPAVVLKGVFVPVTVTRKRERNFYEYTSNMTNKVFSSYHMLSDEPILKGLFPEAQGYCIRREKMIPYYEGIHPVEFYKKYRIEVPFSSSMEGYLRSILHVTNSGIITPRTMKSRPVEPVRVVKDNSTIFYYEGQYWLNGIVIEPHKRIKGRWPEVINLMSYEIDLIEAPEGPIDYMNKRFLPYNLMSATLKKWRDYLLKATKFHYQANNEYMISKDDGIGTFDDGLSFSTDVKVAKEHVDFEPGWL